MITAIRLLIKSIYQHFIQKHSRGCESPQCLIQSLTAQKNKYCADNRRSYKNASFYWTPVCIIMDQMWIPHLCSGAFITMNKHIRLNLSDSALIHVSTQHQCRKYSCIFFTPSMSQSLVEGH